MVTEKSAFFCDAIGFREINFDGSQTHKPDSLLQIVYVEPNRPPFVSEAGNDLKSLQHAAHGHIEPVYLGDGTILAGNEEAKLKGMEGNRGVGHSIIAGPFFMGSISADGSRAVEKLENMLASLESSQERMKAMNAYYRKHKTLDGCLHIPANQLLFPPYRGIIEVERRRMS